MSRKGFTAVAGHGICDFCSPPLPGEYRYPAKSFEMPNPGFSGRHYMSRGAWCACAPCSDLIERGDPDGLARRNPILCALGVQQEIIRRFIANRDGQREPFTGPSQLYDRTRVIRHGSQTGETTGADQ